MDQSSDPGRDEYGLPPVDIDVPDDARDLDRDVQAYRRELRARRRRMRVSRLVKPLTRHGMLIPLVAGCLALTLLSGTLLTVLAGRQVRPGPGRTSPGSTQRTTPPSGQARTQLPDAQVVVDGQQVPLRSLAVPAVLAWVPQGCPCAAALKQLAKQAAQAHVAIYFVGTDRAVAQLSTLAAQAGKGNRQVVADSTNALGLAYQPVGLTAILAHSDDTVGDGDVRRRLSSGVQLETQLRSLAAASQGSASPSASA